MFKCATKNSGHDFQFLMSCQLRPDVQRFLLPDVTESDDM